METTIAQKLDHFISVEDAKALIKAGNKGTPYAALVTKDELMEVLNQEGCNGVNIYINSATTEINPVVVGTDTKGSLLKVKMLAWLPTYPPLGFGWGGNLFSLT